MYEIITVYISIFDILRSVCGARTCRDVEQSYKSKMVIQYVFVPVDEPLYFWSSPELHANTARAVINYEWVLIITVPVELHIDEYIIIGERLRLRVRRKLL